MAKHTAEGRRVVLGDVMDSDFWAQARRPGKGRVVLLAMHHHGANLSVAKRLAERGYEGTVAATAAFPDQVRELEGAGVHAVFNFYAEAGAGFAAHVSRKMDGSDA